MNIKATVGITLKHRLKSGGIGNVCVTSETQYTITYGAVYINFDVRTTFRLAMANYTTFHKDNFVHRWLMFIEIDLSGKAARCLHNQEIKQIQNLSYNCERGEGYLVKENMAW